MLVAIIVALVALAAVSVAFNAMLDRVLQRAALERAADRAAFAGERQQWFEERQLLLNRVVDPTAGVAQALSIGQPAFDPSAEQEWPEMPDFPVHGAERALT